MFLYLYRYGRKENANDTYPAWSRQAVFCPECAQAWLHPSYDYIRRERAAVEGERCAVCAYLEWLDGLHFVVPEPEETKQLSLFRKAVRE